MVNLNANATACKTLLLFKWFKVDSQELSCVIGARPEELQLFSAMHNWSSNNALIGSGGIWSCLNTRSNYAVLGLKYGSLMIKGRVLRIKCVLCQWLEYLESVIVCLLSGAYLCALMNQWRWGWWCVIGNRTASCTDHVRIARGLYYWLLFWLRLILLSTINNISFLMLLLKFKFSLNIINIRELLSCILKRLESFLSNLRLRLSKGSSCCCYWSVGCLNIF